MVALRSVTAAVLLVVISLFPGLSAAADSNARIMIVLDASGSMWGQIAGKAKIEIARSVISELLDDWDNDVQLGLTVYGHRRKGDCSDIEILIPAGEATGEAVRNAVHAVQPKGKTPLSDAVRRAAEHLRYTEDRAAVVLISDGKETCGADPCAVGAELAMSGADFTAHVIGFAVEKIEQEGLRCLAGNTGGLFLTAGDAGSLRSALDRTVEKVKAPPAPVIEDPGEANLDVPAEVPAGSAFEVQWEGPDSRDDFIALVEAGTPEGEYGYRYTYTARGNPAILRAADRPGAYEVRYYFQHRRQVLAQAPVTVMAVTARVVPPPGAAAGSSFEVAWEGPANESDFITIVPAGAPEGEYGRYDYTGRGSPVTLRAPDEPGAYEIRYLTGQTNETLARAPLVVSAVTASLDPPPTATAGSRFDVSWMGPGNTSDFITIVPAGATEGTYEYYGYTSSGNPITLKAPDAPGEYEIRYLAAQSNATLAAAPITVTPVSATLSPPAEVAAKANFEVAWEGPSNDGDYITIVPAGAPRGKYLSYAYTSYGSPASLTAPEKPGPHEVRYIMGASERVLASSPLLVK